MLFRSIRYNNSADINYRFTFSMPNYKLLRTEMEGEKKMSFIEIMPHLSLLYQINAFNNIYINVSRGYKAGGYNTQIFSDILQNEMMNNMMEDLGVYPDNDAAYEASSAISYKPEYTWNYEAGAHFNFVESIFQGNAALFYIDCRNQQLTDRKSVV